MWTWDWVPDLNVVENPLDGTFYSYLQTFFANVVATKIFVFVVCQQKHLEDLSRHQRDLTLGAVTIALAFYTLVGINSNFCDSYMNPAVIFALSVRSLWLGGNLEGYQFDWWFALAVFFGNWFGGLLGGEVFRFFYPTSVKHTAPFVRQATNNQTDKDNDFKNPTSI